MMSTWWMRALTPLVALAGALSAGTAAAQAGSPAPKAPTAQNEALRAELKRMVTVDQDVRTRLIANASDKRILHECAIIDTRNTARMQQIVDRYGWPGKRLVGADGANAAWLLVQHADRDPKFQARCLGLMRTAVDAGDASPADLALLTDRVLVAQHRKQMYGTQFTGTLGGRLKPYPIEDEANVDRRRAQVGLPTMAEYRKILEQVYHADRAVHAPSKQTGSSPAKHR